MSTLPINVTPIPISDLTEATINGAGAFDVLMQANKAHLEQEFQKNRIKGPEYATVYLQSLQQVMQVALEFVLQKQRNAAEVALLEAQIRKTEKEILLIEAQTAVQAQQKINLELEAENIPKEGCKLDAEFDLLQGQVIKVSSETALLGQKIVTERAQVDGMGVDTDSIIGRQKALYVAQTDGFKRDAEQKVAKIMADSWGIRRSTDEGEQANTTNMLDNASIGRAINKLLSGVGA